MGSLGVSEYRGIVSPSYTVCETTRPFDGKYLHYLLRSKPFIQEFERLSYGVRVGQWELRFHDFKKILSVFPPVQEQQQISKFLDRRTEQLDSLIEKTKETIELLIEQRATLINKVVTKGLNPNVEMKDSGVEWIGGVPKGWEVRRLWSLGGFSKGRGIKKDEVRSTGFPCIRYGEIYTTYDRVVYSPVSYIYEETTKNCEPIQKGDALLTGSGETLEDIGKSVPSDS